MHRIPVAVLSIVILLGASLKATGRDEYDAFDRDDRPPASDGRVHGFVRDAAGAAVADASVLAVGATVIAARSDRLGRFQMALPAGEYVLRATRTGYVSTYREQVRVLRSISLERIITLVRQTGVTADAALPDGHAHTDLAWRLRHMPRSVLRDAAGDVEWVAIESADVTSRASGSLFWRAVDSSRRVASRIAGTDFSGQLNFVATASANPSAFAGSTLPRSVAYVVLGAPIGTAGDWRVRGAIGSGANSSWNVLGEYEAHRAEAHALRFGMSYSAHGPKVPGFGQYLRSTLEARSVTGAFARDRWRPLEDLEVDYAVRADRYDFLTSPYLISASGGLRARVLTATFLSIRAGRSMLAPGAEEFLPPPAEGPWLPPERTFTALVSRDPMRAETVRNVEFGAAREFGPSGRARRLHARAFQLVATDQIATLFSTPGAASSGHYRVARAGVVGVSGWAVGISGSLTPVLTGTVEYSRMVAYWGSAGRTRGLRRFAPSAVRDDDERLHDVSATVEASLNDARTRVLVVYRTNTAFSSHGEAGGFGSRFDVQFHQALPYRPLSGSRLELFCAVRTLFRDPAAGASPYDELLTVSPPLRLMGGIQVRF